MWLLDGQAAPDHTTISRFRDERLVAHMEDLFCQFVGLLYKYGELQYKNVFIDGIKIEAYANRYSFVWKKAVEKNKDKLIEKIKVLLEQYEGLIDYPAEGISYCRVLKKVKHHLSKQIKDQNIVFVKGVGRRKTQLQREYEKVEEYITRLEGYEASLGKMKGRNSYSKTDNDATFMRMKEDHMMNGQLKPTYNVQIASEGGYVVGVLLSHERADVNTLIPFIDRIHRNFHVMFSSLIADSGYENEENYQYLKDKGITAYIKPSNYETRKTKKFKNDIGRCENMTYLPEEDAFLCANNRKLIFSGIQKNKTATGFLVKKRRYTCSECEGCSLSSKCLRKAKSKILSIGYKSITNRKEGVSQLIT